MNELLVALIVILLPGIVAATIADKITIHSKWTAFRFTQYSMLLGIACYVAIQLVFWGWAVFQIKCLKLDVDYPILKIWSAALHRGDGLEPSEIVMASLASVPMAFFVSLAVNRKWITKFASLIRVSTKYGEENLFTFYLNTKEIDWVYVREPDRGFTYQGRVWSHSENNLMQEVVLYDVTVFSYEDSIKLYDVPTLYLARPVGSFTIEAIPDKILQPVTKPEEK